MISADTPSRLIEAGRRIKSQGAQGCLISGGCLPDGTVPFRKFLPAIRTLKEELNLRIVLHTGIIDAQIAADLIESNVDVVSMDVIGSNETIKEIYRLEIGVEEYENSLRLLTSAGIRVTPHILIGLHYGKLKGEFNAVDMVSKYELSSLIFIVFTPFKKTVMENVKPPPPMEVAKVLCYARTRLPSTFQSLGCVRPLRSHRIETDLLAIRSGINGIAFPTKEALAFAKENNLKTAIYPSCCSLANSTTHISREDANTKFPFETSPSLYGLKI